MRLVDWFDFIFPKRCIECNKWGVYVCEKCGVGLWEVEQICPECGEVSKSGNTHIRCVKSGGMDGLICLWAYEGVAEKIIREAKYRNYYDRLKALLSLSDERWGNSDELYSFREFLESKPVVMPTSLDVNKKKENGFNQSDLIAQFVAERYRLRFEKRRSRNRGETEIKRVTAENILLVDEVWTNNMTMKEEAITLKQNGAKLVWGLVLAR